MIQIKSWMTGAVLFEREASAEVATATVRVQIGFAAKAAVKMRADLTDADLTDAVLTGADLTDAVLTGAVLTGADLTDAVLTRADLTGADLTGADLTDADLTGAVLTGAVLTGAVLTGAVLTGADLTGALLTDAVLTDAVLTGADIPIIPHIDAAIVAAIDGGGHLEMGDWHRCNTTHCRAGWAITLAGKAGVALEHKIGSAAAAALIYAASRPAERIPNFYASNDAAMADLRAAAAKDPLAWSPP